MASIRKRSGSYLLVVSMGYAPDGRRRNPQQKTVRPPTGLTPKQTEKWLQEQAMIFEMSCKKLNPDIDRSITLEKYTEIWLQTIAPDKLEKSTLVREKQDIKRFKPYLGSYKLVDLRPEHFRSLYTKLRKQKNKATGKPLSEATVEGVHSCLCGILSDAMEGGYLDHNPAWRTYKYAGQKKEKKIADDETVKKLIQALETVSILYETYFKLIIATGMRRGECCALKWEDINYAERSIHVCRNAVKTTGDEIIVKAPKTKAGNRYVYFSGEMESLLREYEAFCAAETERYDRREQTKDDYVFRRKGMKLPMTPSTFTWRFKKILKANDLPTDLNVHSLRHTAASLFIASGTDVGTVAGLLGHSQPSTTLDTLLFEVPSDTEDETIWYDVYLRERPGRDADWTYSDALYHVIRSVDNYGDYRYHHNLPHGAGLIMISKAFAEYFIERHACDEQFIKMAGVMGIPDAKKPEDFITALVELQKACGVADLKMSDYGIQKDECMTLAVNARETMGGLFLANPCPMSDEECAGIFEKSYR